MVLPFITILITKFSKRGDLEIYNRMPNLLLKVNHQCPSRDLLIFSLKVVNGQREQIRDLFYRRVFIFELYLKRRSYETFK